MASLAAPRKPIQTRHFECNICHQDYPYTYWGSNPPWAKKIVFLEDCYALKDPFAPPEAQRVLCLGSLCSLCKNPVCTSCSIFYTARFCSRCAGQHVREFPVEIQREYEKIASAQAKTAT